MPRKHPRGLWVLFVTEMWERYSYYGMRALLVLYLIAQTTGKNPGFGWSEESANQLYGWYCGLCYLTPLLGGLLADKLLGTHRSLVLGGIIMATGQFFLAAAELFRIQSAQAITLSGSPGAFLVFLGGLALIILGSGFFKPCAAVMVGQLYTRTDPRRDAAYTIFYMGINTGAFIAPLVTGWLAAKYGWHWGFASAGAGMILGLMIYGACRPMFLKGIGLAPHQTPAPDARQAATPEQIKAAETAQYERTRPLTRIDWDRMIAILVLTTFAIVFWIGAQQAGASLSVFAQKKTDRSASFLEGTLLDKGEQFPAPWYQSVNPLAIIIFAPVFAWLWGWLDRRGRQPSVPVKFGIGVIVSGIAFIPMIVGSLAAGRSTAVELNQTPSSVQAVLRPVHDQLVKEQKEDEAKKDVEQNAKETTVPDGKPADGETEKEHGFDVLHKVVYRGAEYYLAGYKTRRATIQELYDPQGHLLRRRADLEKGKEEDGDLESVKRAKPVPMALDQVPDAARHAILTQLGGQQPESVQSIVVARQTVAPVGAENEAQQQGKSGFHGVRDVHDFVVTWKDDGSNVTVRVAEDGFLLRKYNPAFERVGLAGPSWLVLMYLIVTWGELCVSPVGLSMVNKLSPIRYQTAMMGIYYGILFIANTAVGYVAALGSKIDQWGLAGKTFLPGQTDFFVLLTVMPIVFGTIMLLLAPRITRMMHGVK